MKKAILALFGLCFLGGAAFAQTYSIDWYSMDGGGGTSTGGVYSISGTIGQFDAGRLSGGNFTIEGGFWAIIGAVQTPGGPPLRVVRSTTNTVVIAWPAPSTGFSLQQNPVVNNGAGWLGVTNMPVVIGSENQVIISTPIGNKFYRLKSP
jgi:hypothetical protein